eukprot:jgi/Tetstr1/466077/TSEL_010663.t1
MAVLLSLPLCPGGTGQLLPWDGHSVPSCAQDAWLPPALLGGAVAAAVAGVIGRAPRAPGATAAAERPRPGRAASAAHLLFAAFLAAAHGTLLLGDLRCALGCGDAESAGAPGLVSLSASGELCLAWLVTFVALASGAGAVPGDGLRAWWLAAAAVEALRGLSALLAAAASPGGLEIGLRLGLQLGCAAGAAGAALLGALQRTTPLPEYDGLGGAPPPPGGWTSPQTGASWLSHLYFGWVGPVLAAGRAKPLVHGALYNLPPAESTGANRDKVMALWQSRVAAWLGRCPEQRHRHGGSSSEEQEGARAGAKGRPSLAVVLHDAYAGFFWKSGFLKVLSFAAFAQPVFLKALINFMLTPVEEASPWGGAALVGGLVAMAILASLATNHYNFRMSRLGVRLRGSLCMLVYEKALTLHPEELAQRGSGQIASLLNIDINNLSWSMPTVHELWSTPLQLATCLYLLQKQIGAAAYTGLAVMVVMAPPNMAVMRAIFRNQRAIMSTRDSRIKLLSEVMGSIKAVKLMTWEGHLMEKICTKRGEEVASVRAQGLMFALSGFLWLITPVLVSTLSFSIFCFFGGVLTAPKAFAALSLFSILRGPLSGLPRVLQLLVQASVALRRLESFLLAKEVVELPVGPVVEPTEPDAGRGGHPVLPRLHDPASVCYHRSPQVPEGATDSTALVTIKGGSFRWLVTPTVTADQGAGRAARRRCLPCCGRRKPATDAAALADATIPLLAADSNDPSVGQPTLKDINLEARPRCFSATVVRPGELVAVVGPVGSGKSSLLMAMLNEISCESGEVQLLGRVSFCPQQPWIMNATLRENILFGQPFDALWYQTVLTACQLQPDLEMLPGGDMAEIGEKGLNLSGGQKARVSLARAVYAKPDVVLLDDVLSAVDVHVATALLHQCLLHPDLLGHAARVVVSHQLWWLNSASHVVMMDGGAIVARGTASTLSASGLLVMSRKAPTSSQALSAPRALLRALGRVVPRRSRRAGSAATSAYTASEVASQSSVAVTPLVTPSPSEIGEGEAVGAEAEAGKPAAKEAPPPAAANQAGITIAEDREEGAVAAGIWTLYLRQLGLGWVATFAALLLASQAAQVLGDTTLAMWTSSLSSSAGQPGSGSFGPLALYAGASLGAVGIMYARSLVLVAASMRAAVRVHNAALWRVLRAPMSWLDATPNGRITNRFQSDQQKLDLMLPATVGNVLAAGAAMLSALIVVCATAPAVLLLLPPVAALFVHYQAVYRSSSREVMRLSSLAASKLYHTFGESLEGCATIRAFGRQPAFVASFRDRIRALQRPQYLDRTIDKWLGLRLDALGSAAVAGAAAYGVAGHCAGLPATSPATLGLSLTYAFSLTSMLSALLMSFAFAETSLVSLERLHAYATLPSEPRLRHRLLGAPSTPEDGATEALADGGRRRLDRRMRAWSDLGAEQQAARPAPEEGATASPPLLDEPGWPAAGRLRFERVCMRYRPGLDLVLRELSFVVEPGQHVGIVGRTGAGKSSLLGVLFRLVDIESGFVEVDGRNICSVGLHTLREAMSIIPQDPVLFSGTLRFNLDPWGSHSDGALHRCLQQVGLAALVEERGEGLAMAIGPNGDNLSVGQRQLLCMARALLRNTRVVVLDEATASIDAEADAAIQRVLAEQLAGATVLTIAHRIHTVMEYDAVMVMAGGQVAEMGPPRALAADPASMFHSLHKAAKAQGSHE